LRFIAGTEGFEQNTFNPMREFLALVPRGYNFLFIFAFYGIELLFRHGANLKKTLLLFIKN
jgi:hypothetical protein